MKKYMKLAGLSLAVFWGWVFKNLGQFIGKTAHIFIGTRLKDLSSLPPMFKFWSLVGLVVLCLIVIASQQASSNAWSF